MVSKQFKKDMGSVFNDLSLVDKLLPVWIILAMILGILLSVYVPKSRQAFDGASIVGVSIPLAVGLIVMMIPPLCKVEWEHFFKFFSRTKYLKPILISLAINWIVGPFLMFGLAWLTLFDEDEYRRGIIMIGLARCIAMVLLWNEIARGDNTLCAVIVLINSLLQVILYAPYQIFFCYVITGDYNASVTNAGISYSLVSKSVAFFLGIPLGFGVLIRFASIYTVGLATYEKKMIPLIGPWALIGLLYTIIVIFIEKGNDFIKEIGSALRCFVPLVAYFMIMWFGTFFFLRWLSSSNKLVAFKKSAKRGEVNVVSSTEESADENSKLLCGCEEKISKHPTKWVSGCSANYAETITQTFTAASNNFELSLAVAISLYGSGSKEAIAATFGPLLEVPILLILAFVAKYFRVKFIWSDVEEEIHADEEMAELNQ
ncbi:sodium bile acid symporter family-domain-containing protein [Scheffersomyces xylosifermentans]|uniref:sodium bile acid symporter family-domain-containing protein n=1 Tax=Scheffersomyces xylosifermentans TaxID=1304137 RepID=UPI00315D10A0